MHLSIPCPFHCPPHPPCHPCPSPLPHLGCSSSLPSLPLREYCICEEFVLASISSSIFDRTRDVGDLRSCIVKIISPMNAVGKNTPLQIISTPRKIFIAGVLYFRQLRFSRVQPVTDKMAASDETINEPHKTFDTILVLDFG